jgi:para-nitrobenzyl esterase
VHPVETAHGSVVGLDRGAVQVFRGVPYAASTGGHARWRAPAPPAPWQGVRDAASWAPAAPQPPSPLGIRAGAAQSEDCLALNVWTPSRHESLPVMVWFHGGSFTGGTGATPWYSGTRLAQRGVVVVTVNYRLGALGFLDLASIAPDRWPDAANVGLLDQQAALRWVKENIEGFGGDPRRVTVFGESAGAMSTALHLVMHESSGLFHRAVMQSGALAHTRSPGRSADVAERFVARVGGADRLAACSTEEIVSAQVAIAPDVAGPLPFMPTADGTHVPRHPLSALADGSAAGVPVIIGTTRDEMRLFTTFDPTVASTEPQKFERRIRTLLDRHAASIDPADAVALYRRRLGGDATLAQVVSAAMTDTEFRVPACQLADRQSAHAEVFTYLFQWASDAWDGQLGSCHALEIPFVFDNLGQPGVAMLVGQSPPGALAQAMADAWVRFAQGEPPDVTDGDGRRSWVPHDGVDRPTMVFDARSRMERDPLGDERSIWMQAAAHA